MHALIFAHTVVLYSNDVLAFSSLPAEEKHDHGQAWF